MRFIMGTVDSETIFEDIWDENRIPDFEIQNKNASGLFYSKEASILGATFAILFTIVGVFGNSVTILALLRSSTLKAHSTTWFVLSLCFSDLLFCTINLPLTASRYIYKAWVFDDFLCKLFPFFFYGNFGASLMNITLIAVNRYILISHYSIYDKVYRWRNVAVMIACIWTFCFGVMIPPFLGVWGTLGLDPSSFSCTILKQSGKSPKKFLFVFGILIPCLIISLCYAFIFFKVRKTKRALLAIRDPRTVGIKSEENRSQTSQKREDIRLTKMMFIIFATYLVSFLPLMIFNVIDDEARRFPAVLHVVASVLAWGSTVVNPVIYAVSNRQYRQSYLNLFHLCCKKETQGSKVASRSGSGRTFYSDVKPKSSLESCF